MSQKSLELNRITPPERLVEDTSHEDDFAKFISDRIYTYCEDLIGRSEIDEFYGEERQVGWYSDVSKGHCEALAVYVYNEVENSNFNTDRVSFLGRIHSETADDYHTWIRYTTPTGDEYHFDAECPWGINNWKQLRPVQNKLITILLNSEETTIDPRNRESTIRGLYMYGKETGDPSVPQTAIA